MADMKLKLDLHDIYNRGGDIDRALPLEMIDVTATRDNATHVDLAVRLGSLTDAALVGLY
jgi:hypothetical protein